MEVDFLLIGQGLAGTVLSQRLLKAGKTVGLIDEPGKNKSSRVAAGLYNPVTGRKMVKTWNADLLFPEIIPLYRELEDLLGIKIIYPRPIYRPFVSIEEQNEWMGKSGDEGFRGYIETVRMSSKYDEVNDPYGGILLKNCGFVDLAALLDAYTGWLNEKGFLVQSTFDEDKLIRKDDGFIYGEIKAKNLIYCNGIGAMKSRFFDWLPFAPVKGEILEINEEFKPYEIINRGVFRITMPDGLIRVGSTYSRHDLDTGPSSQGKRTILEKLEKLVHASDREIIQHKSGIRPATRDRRPFLGKYPQEKNVYIFNGFGAKGVSLVPYFSKVMLDLLIHGEEPEKGVNISRFFKYI
ncbi:FAD-dependent oxidoreductase [Echinicola jeungdonensis]|uniref:NAD(P)/FAD-dependent oxidoreductase n=1 Tax=Echinicola jeungdonensis TaxID=709343 RepID=A0ABV5J4E8_9BACT|nr:FAD-dependent oxidoreductase [Echinicola jeungdonensis]MDN3667920.1 FAD-dependent oxidoreductase [Echinicola jeungdonensis]